MCVCVRVCVVEAAVQLRRELAAFVLKHPDLDIADDPLKDWVAWDSNGR